MWEAWLAFHICIDCTLPELLRRLIAQRTMRAFPVILLAPARQSVAHIVQRPEPAGVEALVAQPSVKALDVAVLHRAPWLDVHQSDLPILRPGQHAPRGELRPVVRAHVLRAATLPDQPFEHPRHPPRAETGVGLQRQALARVYV